jgi:hypothetical protein
MMRWFSREWPPYLVRDPRRGPPEPTAAWMGLALGFTALTSLAVAGASDLVLLPIAWSVAAVATFIARHF